jgi:hypothetical protein
MLKQGVCLPSLWDWKLVIVIVIIIVCLYVFINVVIIEEGVCHLHEVHVFPCVDG